MIIMIIIFKGMVIEITMEYPEIRDHNKHKTPHNLNSGLNARVTNSRVVLLCYSLSIQIILSWVGGVHSRLAYGRRGTKN